MSLSVSQLAWVALGGALGAVARVLISSVVPTGRLPWGTLLVNVLGSLFIGWLLGRFGPWTAESGRLHAGWVAGFCGGFTTFSAFSWQLWEQVRQGQWLWALLHGVLAVVLCLAATALGVRLAKP